MSVGTGNYRFRVAKGWGTGPLGREFGGVVTGQAVDSADRVYINRRSPPAVLVYDRDGRYITAWGEGVLHNPHGIHITADDHVWVADMTDHTVREFRTDGELLRTLGTCGEAGPPGMPFNMPTKAVVAPSGEIFVSDGYGQHRVHRFSAEGTLLASWGSKGAGPGEFGLPHGICVDQRGRVVVADREPNHRVQIFDAGGNLIEVRSVADGAWLGFIGPNEVYVDQQGNLLVAECGHRISIWTVDGELLSRWGDLGDAPGQFAGYPHSLCVDSHGDLYVGEVPHLPNRLQKFERL